MSYLFVERPRRKPRDLRSPRRQYLVLRLHRAGPRVVMEAMLELEPGPKLDAVLERYARIPADIYQALGADELPFHQLTIVRGGRR